MAGVAFNKEEARWHRQRASVWAGYARDWEEMMRDRLAEVGRTQAGTMWHQHHATEAADVAIRAAECWDICGTHLADARLYERALGW